MDSPFSFSDDYALVFQQRIRASRENLDLESKCEARCEDRISQLPDAVLRHILSFLPSTKCVVRTSILSTRWKHIWAYVPNLYLDDEEFFSSADFVAFVDRVLLVRDSSAIQKFHLHFNYCHTEDFSRIDGWIRTAVSCNVVELDLSVDSDEEEMFELPISLLTCETLKVLSLMSMFIINVPTSGCFPSLKFLHLHFTVNCGYQTSMDLFDIPVLEHLSIYGDLEDNLLDFKISAPELKTLRIDMYSSDDLHWLYNFSIDAPKLEKLDLKGGSLSNFSLKNTKSLVEADIKLYLDRNEYYVGEDSVNRATEFLAGISMVKYLSLSWGIYEACTVPAFDNLSKLTLFLDGSHWWKFLMKLLERSPNLECLVIDDGFYPPRRQLEAEMIELPEKKEEVFELTEQEVEMRIDREYRMFLNWIAPESVPNCLLSHLKTISIKGFKGKAYIIYLDEMELTKYLLKNGRVLEKMTIYTPGLWRGTKEDIYSEISMFEWGSKTVQVELIEKLFYRC